MTLPPCALFAQVSDKLDYLVREIDASRTSGALSTMDEESTAAMSFGCLEWMNRDSILSPTVLTGPKVVELQLPNFCRVDPVISFRYRSAARSLLPLGCVGESTTFFWLSGYSSLAVRCGTAGHCQLSSIKYE